MKATLERNDFAGAVVRAAEGIPKSPEQPVRAGMHIVLTEGKVRFGAGNGDITMCAWAPAGTDGTGEFILPGKLLAEVAKTLPDRPVTLTDGTLSCGRAAFSFPVSREPYPGPYATAPLLYSAQGLPEAFAKVAPMASRTAANAYAGVFLEARDGVLHVTASNRYHLGTVALELGEGHGPDGSCLIPASAVSSFPPGETELGWDTGVATFATDGYSVTTRKLAARFPDWRVLLPEEEPSIEIGTRAFREMVTRARVVAADSEPVTLSVHPGYLALITGSHEEEMETGGGKDFRCLLGIENLLGVLRSCDETFRLGYTEPLKPVHIHSGSLRAALLPRREV